MAQGRNSFYSVLSEAIADLMEHGFDSNERVERWVRALNIAARASLVPAEVLQRNMRSTLEVAFRRATSPAHMRAVVPGISQYTIEHVKPRLRAELDRRIMASANLIKLNREASIQKTLQRFSGWATSIPIGGTEALKRTKVKDQIRRGIAGLSFEERRVVIDQGFKLSSAVSDIVATDGGAIAAAWHHVMEGGGYQARPDHVARNGHIFLIRDSWAHKQGLVKLAGRKYTDEVTAPGEEPYCLPGESKIPYADGVQVAYRRWFSGELASVVTASGKSLRATPNHPVLTTSGWKAIGALQLGDDIIEIAEDGVPALEQDDNDRVIPSIEDIFCTLNERGVVQSLDLTPAGFHGDGTNGQVETIPTARSLMINWQTTRSERRSQLDLTMTNGGSASLGDGGSSRFAMTTASDSGMSGLGDLRSSARADELHSDGVCFGSGTRGDSGGTQSGLDEGARHSASLGHGENAIAPVEGGDQCGHINSDARSGLTQTAQPYLLQAFIDGGRARTGEGADLKDALPFASKISKVISVDRYSWSGHVFNLQTRVGWYVANGILTHNCRCHYVYIFSLADLPPEMLTAKGMQWLKDARAGIRRITNAA